MKRRYSLKKNLKLSIIFLAIFLFGVLNIHKHFLLHNQVQTTELVNIRLVSLRNVDEIESSATMTENSAGARTLLWVQNTENNTRHNETCNEPSIKEFPTDVFTQKQRRYGAVFLHIFMALYMFVALAFVCDDYFISSLEKICERLDLSEDVAGATFMAAGSSAPELFTSIIGVFITKGDVGVGTVVGSAVFNILVIISICGLFAGQVVKITWWPLFRDSLYYVLSVAMLIWVLYDGVVTWYESLVMLLMYAVYILLMKFNPIIVKKINSRRRLDSSKKRLIDERKISLPDDNSDNLQVKYSNNLEGSYQEIDLIDTNKRKVTWKELGMMIMLTDQFAPTTRLRAACLIVIFRGDRKQGEYNGGCHGKSYNTLDKNVNSHLSCEHLSVTSDDGMEGRPFLHPQGSKIRLILWMLSLPLVTLLFFTIPDCRKARWETWYPVTFLMSIFWIGVFSYLLVWVVCVIGFTLGIPDVIMGITFLAAGTSIPDAISSLLVAREGQGDMAVSNSIGSNIFDILIGLAAPWFIKSAIVDPGRKIVINSRGLIYSVSLLFASIMITISVIHWNKWKLDKKSGFILLFLYAIFLTISASIEFNLFGFVNFPTCKFEG